MIFFTFDPNNSQPLLFVSVSGWTPSPESSRFCFGFLFKPLPLWKRIPVAISYIFNWGNVMNNCIYEGMEIGDKEGYDLGTNLVHYSGLDPYSHEFPTNDCY